MLINQGEWVKYQIQKMSFTLNEELQSIAQNTGMIFCPRCENLLDMPRSDHFVCRSCDYKFKADLLRDLVVVSQSRSNSFVNPDLNLTQRDEKLATIDEKCPKCNNPEMTFFTMQLRGADEGATVFYSCPNCMHKFSVNN
eukprot:NODE_29_length_33183_cov_0.333666.p23 type:complete len:140 gc:universal NODE_29_length_33183_cov_0.333666:25380-25799(+)